MHFAVRRGDGSVEPVGIHAVGVTLAPGDTFEMICASGGGYGDPLDRDPQAVLADLNDRRVDVSTAHDVYGVIFARDGTVDLAATEARRAFLRKDRLRRAQPAVCPMGHNSIPPNSDTGPAAPLYPGVIQRGDLAIAEGSGAVLARAPGNWLDGCPMLDMPVDERAGGIIARAHLDPVTGRMLYVDVIRTGDGPSIDVFPERWARALSL